MDFIIGATTGMKEGTRTITFTVVSVTFKKRTSNLSSLCSAVTVSLFCFVLFTGMCLLLTMFGKYGDLSVGNYDDSDNVIQKVCVGNVDECNDFMSWAMNFATLCK